MNAPTYLGFRSLQSLFAVTAMMLLTGAKGEGCGRVVVAEPPSVAPPAPACAVGWHYGSVCTSDPGVPVPVADDRASVDGSDANPAIGAADPPRPAGECHDECVPDGPCADGLAQQWICSGGSYEGGAPRPADDMPVCQGNGCTPPPSCELSCLPASCSPGSHAEWSCAGSSGVGSGGAVGVRGGASEAGSTDSSAPSRGEPAPEPMPPSDCAMTCVADSACPPGSMEQGVCSAMACAPGEDCPPPVCFTQCVPGGDDPQSGMPSEPPPAPKPL